MCNECGGWFKILSPSHLKKHGITTEEYKKKYGLTASTGLVSDVIGNIYAEKITKVTNNGKKSIQDIYNSLPEEKKREIIKNKKNGMWSDEHKNNCNTCPKQLKEATINYVKRFKRLPTSFTKREGAFEKVCTLKRRFGSLNNAFSEYGLPTRYRSGSTTQYVFPDKTSVFFNSRKDSNDELFRTIVERCKVLR